ncbi:AAA family ATPase [Sphingomonas jaspsi]|uniref:AAA family ATPase n=1 Tax=Sphingomonas jaspsi TaxID=392409 RepID=UPI0004BA6C56|nr:ATP-binding protein [Sphingomonas jaspsi]
MTLIVLHGVESVGKTTLGRELASYFGAQFLPEFGRSYCEINGTDISADELLLIGRWQQHNIEVALTEHRIVISDTDALMTAAWARMMLGHDLPELFAARKGDLYLHCSPDTPFVSDGLRVYGNPEERARFDSMAKAVLHQVGIRPVILRGSWDARRNTAKTAIRELIGLEPISLSS